MEHHAARLSCYTRFVQNVTFRIDEATLKRARIRALERGTSLNAVVEAFLTSWSSEETGSARRRLVELAERHAIDARLADRDATRDELYEERTRWPRS